MKKNLLSLIIVALSFAAVLSMVVTCNNTQAFKQNIRVAKTGSSINPFNSTFERFYVQYQGNEWGMNLQPTASNGAALSPITAAEIGGAYNKDNNYPLVLNIWQPIEEEYAIGYLGLEDDNTLAACSGDPSMNEGMPDPGSLDNEGGIPSDDSPSSGDDSDYVNTDEETAVTDPNELAKMDKNGDFCIFPEGRKNKSEYNFVDRQNAAMYNGKLYDVRIYIWSANGPGKPMMMVGNYGKQYGGQKRYKGALMRKTDGITMVEFHFYKQDTLFYYNNEANAYYHRADTNPNNSGNYNGDWLRSREVSFKGVIRLDDIDSTRSEADPTVEVQGAPGPEGYAAINGLRFAWMPSSTSLSLRQFGHKNIFLPNSTELACEETSNAQVSIKKWTGGDWSGCPFWGSYVNTSSELSWRNEAAAIRFAFESTPDSPFTIAYKTTNHASSMTSLPAMVNYVLVGDIPNEPVIQNKIVNEKAKLKQESVAQVDFHYYDNTIKRLAVTDYSWFDVNKYSGTEDLPDYCTVDGWYATNDNGVLKNKMDSGLIILGYHTGNQPTGYDTVYPAGKSIYDANGNIIDPTINASRAHGTYGDAYVYYGKVSCGTSGVDTASSTDNDVAYAGEDITFNLSATVKDALQSSTETSYSGTTAPSTKIYVASFIVPAGVDLNSIEQLKGSANMYNSKGTVEYSTENTDICGFISSAIPNSECTLRKTKNDDYEYPFGGKAVGEVYPQELTFSAPDKQVGTKICAIIGVNPGGSNKTADANRWNISGASCNTIAKKPNFQVWNGDIFTQGSITTSTSKKRYDGKTYGSWAEFGITANGTVRGIASASALGYSDYRAGSGGGANINNGYCSSSRLTISNINCSQSEAGKANVATSVAINELANQLKRDFPSLTAADGNFEQGGYVWSPEHGKTVIIRATGTMKITGNICLSSNCSDTSNNLTLKNESGGLTFKNAFDVPQIFLIADKIEIDENVTQIDAWMIATSSRGIDTCSQFNTTINSDTCNKTLKINGPVFAFNLSLHRTAGADYWRGSNPNGDFSKRNLADDGSITPAEIFNLSPLSYLWAYAQSNSLYKLYVSYIKETAPRY